MVWSALSTLADLAGVLGMILSPVRAAARRFLGWRRAHVFSGRESVDQSLPKTRVFNDLDNEVYGYWLSGRGVVRDINERNAVQSIIIPDPESYEAAHLQSKFDLDYDLPQMLQDIESVGGRKDIDVIYNQHAFTGTALTICNPFRNDGWLLMEHIVPEMHPDKRPHYRITKQNAPEVFESYWRWFVGLRDYLTGRSEHDR